MKKVNLKKNSLGVIASSAKVFANVGAKNACGLFMYQPKMPDKLKKQNKK